MNNAAVATLPGVVISAGAKRSRRMRLERGSEHSGLAADVSLSSAVITVPPVQSNLYRVGLSPGERFSYYL